jgi:glutathione S-transferase
MAIEIGYWNIRGLAAPLRMMCMYAKAPFTQRAYGLDGSFDRSAWLVIDKPALKEKNPFINLPYVKDGDVLVSQSNACLAYLGRKFGFWGNNDEQVVMCETMMCEITDIRNAVVGFSYPAEAGRAQGFIDSLFGGALGKFELYLSQCKTFSEARPFLVDGRITAPDFHLFEMLLQVTLISETYGCRQPLFGNHPSLQTYFDGFGRLPGMAKYLQSPLASMPLNNLMANFGSLGSGGKWTPGVPLPPPTDGMHFD